MGSSNRSGEQRKQMAELSKNLKEGERILEPTRRPDGTLRKPIRIRAGHVPEDEVVIYQSKGSLMKKEMASLGPPGYEPDPTPKPKTKAAKRNERKKEKRLQAAAEKGNISEDGSSNLDKEEAAPSNGTQSVNVLVSGLDALNLGEARNPGTAGEDTEKRIRALKKKIRLTEAQQQKTAPKDLKPEQLEKFSKLEEWRQELKALEDKEEA
ncbi:partner of Y14-MAGO [Raphanus sativus]|uniref:Partner of Y14 and mago n=1 Tax=Raphanus sativus TaxID=3726 RepID=A0A6J0KM78_RAPSA|nr:partner of Y14 and mago [Raphanus sativus]KAJ4879168.1 partner of Y14-MAGO [Raphanus sativus]